MLLGRSFVLALTGVVDALPCSFDPDYPTRSIMRRFAVLAVALLLCVVAVSAGTRDRPTQSDASAAGVAAVHPSSSAGPDPFSLWLRSNPRSYSPSELLRRRAIFSANLAKIADHNERRAARGLTYTLALNEYADLSFEEFRERKIGRSDKHKLLAQRWNATTADVAAPVSRLFTPHANAAAGLAGSAVPTNLDWRLLNAVTPIKNQEGCNADYAFAAVAALEGAHAIATKALQVLSEQQIVDCSVPQGNEACQTGNVASAFQYLIDATNDKTVGGSALASLYPYANEAQTCGSPPTMGVAGMKEQVQLPQGDEAALLNAVNLGPVAVYVDSSQEAWQVRTGKQQYSRSHSAVPRVWSASSTLLTLFLSRLASLRWSVLLPWNPQRPYMRRCGGSRRGCGRLRCRCGHQRGLLDCEEQLGTGSAQHTHTM